MIIGIAKGAEAVRAGRVAARSVAWFAAIYALSAVIGIVLIALLLNLLPLPSSAAAALSAGMAAIDPTAVAASVPGAADFFRSIIPANVIAAAADGNVMQLVVFTALFATALSAIEADRRRAVVAVFEGIADALLVVIGWVLWIAPLGVFALSFTLGATAGGAAFAAVLHYIVLVSLLGLVVTAVGYAIAAFAGGIPLGTFAKGMIGAQTIALTTQSSLASLPAMLASARILGVSQRVADVTLPLAVALFRATGPAMNVGVAYLRRPLARAGAELCPACHGHRRCGAGELRFGQLAGTDQLPDLGQPDRAGDGRADRAARHPRRGREHPRHLPHHRQCDAGRGGDHRGGPR